MPPLAPGSHHRSVASPQGRYHYTMHCHAEHAGQQIACCAPWERRSGVGPIKSTGVVALIWGRYFYLVDTWTFPGKMAP